MTRQLKFIGIGFTVLLAGLLFGFLATWPSWLRPTAEEKMRTLLASKFDLVEYEEFELDKDHAVIRDLHVSRPGVDFTFPLITITFTPNFWDRKVIVDSITFEGGSLQAELEALKELRGPTADKPAESSSRVDLSNTSVHVQELVMDLEAKGLHSHGTLNVTSKSIKGPFDLELVDSTLLRNEQILLSSRSFVATIKPDEPFPIKLNLAGVSADYEGVAIKDVEGFVELTDSSATDVTFNLSGKTDAGRPWTLEGTVDRLNNSAQGHLAADRIKASKLPLALPIDPGYGTITVDLDFLREGDTVAVRGTSSVRDLHVFHEKLARDAVILNSDFGLGADIDLSTRELQFRDFTVQPRIEDQLSPIKLEAQGRVLWAKNPMDREIELELHMGTQPCQEVLRALPPGLAPALRDFELAGETTIDFKTLVKMSDPDATVLEGGLDLDRCQILKVPDVVSSLEDSFMHRVRMKNGDVIERPLIRGYLTYASWDRIPSFVPAAVLSTEDGSFWAHDGMRSKEIYKSLRKNIELGTFRRGASTLTMQMVKNVLLSHEKTISRKMQEMFLTWVVEKRLSKQRILEIYLNVVEFGPGIYGIFDAADHYFGKPVEELTSLEAVFLATLLPKPVDRHEMWCRGAVTPKHDKYVHQVHRRMLSRGVITQAEFDAAEEDGIVFSRTGWTSEAACLAHGKEVSSGSHTQVALSGLLSG